MDNISAKTSAIQISKEEIEIIRDIRKIDFGRISIIIQNSTVTSREVTTITKMNKNKNCGDVGAGRDKKMKEGGFLVLLSASILPIIEILSGA